MDIGMNIQIKSTYIISILTCAAMITVFWLGCRRRGNVLLELSIDGQTVEAIIKEAGVDPDGNLEVLLNVPDSLDAINSLRRKGVELRKIVHSRPKITKTPYPLTTDSAYVINNPYICTNVTNLKMMIIVHSATQNFQRRRLIRETWANKKLFKNFNTRILFLFGLTKNKKNQALIENESVVYGDIVQGNFIDSYHNLTHKGVLSFRWLSQHCLHAQMVVKVDDDMFINPFILIEKFYPKLKSKERHILCHLRKKGSSPIIRGKGKWMVVADEFKGYSHYPVNYCNGYVVLISPDIIRSLYRASYLTPFFWVDDVYLYGLLPLKAGHVTHEEIRSNMTLNVSTGLDCYTKKKQCGYLAVNAWKDGAIETLWYSALRQISPEMKKQINVDYKL